MSNPSWIRGIDRPHRPHRPRFLILRALSALSCGRLQTVADGRGAPNRPHVNRYHAGEFASPRMMRTVCCPYVWGQKSPASHPGCALPGATPVSRVPNLTQDGQSHSVALHHSPPRGLTPAIEFESARALVRETGHCLQTETVD